MIVEDYCSFELSKLLKEKGFNWPCHGSYRIEYPKNKIVWSLKPVNDAGQIFMNAPTHQMAMKWLREKHSIFIGIEYNNYYKQYKANITMMELSKSAILKKAEAMIKYSLDKDFFGTYEEAVEAAIKYCLTTLI